MEDQLTPSRIANSIMQDKNFSGYYVLVEGKKDVKVYNRFLNPDIARIKLASGKYRLREVYEILRKRSFERKFGIRDADFLRVKGNPKFNSNYSDYIFATDGHDSEIMMVTHGVLRHYLTIVSDEERVVSFEKEVGCSLSELIFNLLYELGCLRLASKRFELGLSFKPVRPEGNKLKIEKFISVKNWTYLGREKMIQYVMEYSKNRDNEISNAAIISEKLQEIIAEKHPAIEIINGHDVSELLWMISRDGLKSKNKILQNADCVEDLLIASFDFAKFTKTELFKSIENWQNGQSVQIFST